MRVLLDSHVVLWAAATPEALSSRAARLLADERAELVVSVVTLWELTIKISVGKLRAPAPPEVAASRLCATELGINGSHVQRLRDLPLLHHNPFDRMLVAQAVEEGLVLVTSDRLIRPYPVA